MSKEESVSCPHCGKTYAWNASYAGRQVRCKGCAKAFVFMAASAPPADASAEYDLKPDDAPIPPVLKHCPSCGESFPAHQVMCSRCGCNTGAIQHASAFKTPDVLTLPQILKMPFRGDLPAEAIVQTLGFFGWSLLIGVVAFLTIISFGTGMTWIFMGMLLLAALLTAAWLMQRYLAVASQYEAGAVTCRVDRSLGEALGIALFIALITAALVVGGFFYRPLMLPFIVILAGMYGPMAVAMAGAYRVLNPIKVVEKIISVFGGYLVVFLYSVSFYLFVNVAARLIQMAGSIWLGTFGLILGSVIGVTLGQYGLVSIYAMTGSLLRRYKQPQPPARQEYIGCVKYLGISLALTVAIITFSFTPTWKSIQQAATPEARSLAAEQKQQARKKAQEEKEKARQEEETAQAVEENARREQAITDERARLEKDWATYKPVMDAHPVSGQPMSPGTTVVNSLGMTLAYIPPGQCILNESSYSPRKPRVRISRGFFMGTAEVTQKEFTAVMGRNPSIFLGENLPVHNVTWLEAAEFCAKLSQREGKRYRLPSDAQWEYACRAGTHGKYNVEGDPRELSWFSDNSATGDGPPRAAGKEKSFVLRGFPHPVAGKKPNAWGLYDMHGNVAEWTADFSYYYPQPEVFATDPVSSDKPGSFRRRTVRGGSFYYPVENGVSFQRENAADEDRASPHYGFRVICDIAGEP